jgi:hypothetical protein
LFEDAKPFGEEVAADPWKAVEQVGEPSRSRRELAHDQQRPPIADHVECPRQGAVLLITMLGHKFSLETIWYIL